MTKAKTAVLPLIQEQRPIVLAPLAGVSDHPFRRICSENGADLTYVEMISATAFVYRNEKTIEMMARHPDEGVLGVQITGKSVEDTEQAIVRLHEEMDIFDTIDINMGCPVRKVVKTGCGSAILKDPDRVYRTVKACRAATHLPLSVKIRLGWDNNSVNGVEVTQAAEMGGADWVTVHGRTRADDYSTPVNLAEIKRIVDSVDIPVLGNGNIFGPGDAVTMEEATGVRGVMVSRGSLGNPWAFDAIKGKRQTVTVEDWLAVVMRHLDYQQELYGNKGRGAVAMRKHLLWYSKGWPHGKKLREAISEIHSHDQCAAAMERFAEELVAHGITEKSVCADNAAGLKFDFDPKYQMDRAVDRPLVTGDEPSAQA